MIEQEVDISKICLFSMENESSTDSIIEYFHYLSDCKRVIERINDTDSFKKISIELGRDVQSINFGNEKNDVTISDQLGLYRRGRFIINKFWLKDNHHEKVIRYINEELVQINYFIHKYSTKIGSYNDELDNNKLVNLSLARGYGLLIPNSLVTTCKLDLLKFIKQNKRVITKPIHHGHIKLYDSNGNLKAVSPGTTIINSSEAFNLNDYFAPSFFQEYIEKELEIRVFYLEGKLYPMAIFSQNDNQTKVDFRNYNFENPNRNIPFSFPKKMEKNIIDFFKKLNLTTCSADFILSKSNEFYFLEINPTGQFGWVSKNCNYYLEKEIASKLACYE